MCVKEECVCEGGGDATIKAGSRVSKGSKESPIDHCQRT